MATKKHDKRSDGERIYSPKSKLSRSLIFACVVTAFGSYSFGYSLGYSSPAAPALEFSGILKKEQVSWFVSLLTVGAIISSLSSGVIIDRFGLKRSIQVSSLFFLLGFGIITFAKGASVLYIGRFLCGLACGIASTACPIYLSEVAPVEYRGFIVSCGSQVAVTIGILFAYLFGLIVSWSGSVTALSVLGLIVPLLNLIMMSPVPDSPRWLLMQSRKQDAKNALGWIRGSYHDVEDELRDFEENLDPKEEIAYSDFLKPTLLQPLKVSVGLMFFQQLSGINAVMFYTVSIFVSAGLGSVSTYASILIGLLQVIFSFFACIQMDKLGRRKLLLFGAFGMAISHFVMAYYYHSVASVKEVKGSSTETISKIPVISLSMFIISFALSWGPVPGLMMSEVFPQKARAFACALSTLTNWSGAFLITKEFPDILEILGKAGAFGFFGICCLVAILFVYKIVPETKGKSLEDIELYFLGRSLRGI